MSCSFVIKTSYFEEDFEIALRYDDLEINHYGNLIRAVRKYGVEGVFVVSSSRLGFDELMNIVDKHSKASSGSKYSVYCGEFYSGSSRVGSGFSLEEVVDLVKYVYGLLHSNNLNGEVIALSRHVVNKHVVDDYGVEAVDERSLIELYVYTYVMHMGRLLSTGKITVSHDIKQLYEASRDIVEQVVDAVKKQAGAKKLSPIHTGAWKLLLRGDASNSLFHEITHLLQADEPVKLNIGYRICDDLKIVEDPFYPSVLMRIFDDELYPAWRRVLVDDGLVVDYLRTRLFSENSKPGNARGVFTRSKPMYHQLIVSGGDWSFDEVIDEFKKLIIVSDIVKAELFNDYIVIVPEHGILLEGDKQTPIHGFTVNIPVKRLDEALIGFTRELNMRYSYEKNFPIYEISPSTIVEARIII